MGKFAEPANERLHKLRRMQWIATGTLLVSATTFGITRYFESRWPPLAYLRAFAEAATIGGCADWFAATALFRHPFGIPIPHTAIVPRNKDRIAQSVGAFVSDNFLAPDVVTARLKTLDLAGRGARWLAFPENARRTNRWLARIAAPLLDDAALKGLAEQQLQRALETVSTTPLILHAARMLKERGTHFRVFDEATLILEEFLLTHDVEIQQSLADHSHRWIPRWVDEKLAAVCTSALRDTLRDLREPTHPWRDDIDRAVERFLDQAASDPAVLATGETFKQAFFKDTGTQGHLARMWSEIRTAWKDSDDKGEGGLSAMLTAFGRRCARDADLQAAINRGALRLVERHAIPYRESIGDFIVGIVSRWETETLVDKLELQVGPDLQYIRLNGTLVGGLVGLALFAVTRFFD